MKGILQFLFSLILHPVAMIMAWMNIVGRSDLNGIQKILWCALCIIWGIGPILYITVGKGELW